MLLVLIVGSIATGVLWVLWFFSTLVLYLLVGGLIAYLVKPQVDRLEGLGLGRLPSIAVAFVVVIGLFILLVTTFIPFVWRQVGELFQQVSIDMIVAAAEDIEQRLGRIVPLPDQAFAESVRSVFETLFQEERLGAIVGSMVDIFANIFYATLVIPFVTFFFLKDGDAIRKRLLQWVPNRYFEVTLMIMEKVELNLGRYFRALFFQCLSVAIVASITLSWVGLDYALAVGVFTGLANTIPYFGPIMGFLAGTLVGVVQTGDFSLTLGVLVAMGVTQVMDNLFFQPFIFSRAAKAHPLIILFAVLVGAQLAGIIGMLVAIPVITVLRVVAQEILWSWRNYRILRAG